MKEGRKTSGSCLALAMIILASSTALAQSSSDSALKNREPGVPDNPVSSNQPVRQQQSKERPSPGTPTEGNKSDGHPASDTAASKDGDKASSGKKIPMGSGGGGVTGAVGR
jgi:hypothetical protein